MPRYLSGIPNVPEAIGPYSQAVIADNMVYLSGQIPIDPKTNELVSGGIEEQTEQVMKNILAVLGFLEIEFSHVVKTTMFLADMKDFHIVNRVYTKWLCGVEPARETIQAAALPKGCGIEMSMIAVLELKDGDMLPQGSIKDLQDLQDTTLSCKKEDA